MKAENTTTQPGATLEPITISVNTAKLQADLTQASIILKGINGVLETAYKLGMKPLQPNELSFVELIYVNGANSVKSRIEATLRSSKPVANLPEAMQIESIRLHMELSGIAPLMTAADNCKQSRFQCMPFSFGLCVIDEARLVRFGNMEAIRLLYSTIITTTAQHEFYELSKQVAENLTRLYELSQQSEKLGFRYRDTTEFLIRLDNLFTCKGEAIEAYPEWLQNI